MSQINVNTIANSSGTSAITLDSNGIVNPKGCAFYMYQNTAQSISDVTETQIQWHSELFDTHGSIVNLTDNRVDFPSGTQGIWYISFTWRLSNTVPFRQIAYVNKNTTSSSGSADYLKFEQSNYSQTTNSNSVLYCIWTYITCEFGDYLTFTGYHGYGSARNTSVGRTDTYCSGFRVSSN